MKEKITARRPQRTWFPVDRGRHSRTLHQQLQGLRHVFDEVVSAKKRGRSLAVLDAACAEGLIGLELLKVGAWALHGVELVPSRVADARRLAGSALATFEVGDLNRWQAPDEFDIVLALSVLHKLPDPGAVARRLAAACSRMLVVRLPPPQQGREGWVIVDERSGGVACDLRAVLAEFDLNLEEEAHGYGSEWIGFWRKKWPTKA
jgi:hypothetical protein